MDVVNSAWYMKTSWPEKTAYVGRNPKIWSRSGGEGPIVFSNKFPVAIVSLSNCIRADFGHNMLKMLDVDYQKKVQSLEGHNVACHCAPKPCHGHTLVMACESLQGKGDFPKPNSQETLDFLKSMKSFPWGLSTQPMKSNLRSLVLGMIEEGQTNPQLEVLKPGDPLSLNSEKICGTLGMKIAMTDFSPAQIQHLAKSFEILSQNHKTPLERKSPLPKESLNQANRIAPAHELF